MRLINFADVNHRDLEVKAGRDRHQRRGDAPLAQRRRRRRRQAHVHQSRRRRDTRPKTWSASRRRPARAPSPAKQLDVRPFMRQGEVLETVPGVIITQHSGEGKANQYFLRGFNLDHGSDFAMTVAGTPVNMPTHAHSQGYSDINFLIPELVAGVQYSKGPYFADQGDFATAGAGNINYATTLDRPLVRVESGHLRLRPRAAGRLAQVRQGQPAGGVRDVHQLRALERPGLVPEVQRRAALQPGRQRQRALADVHGLPRQVERDRSVATARDRLGTHRPVRIGRPDRRRAHLSLQRRRRMAARHGQHADQDSGVRPRLRPQPDLELHVLPGRPRARRPAGAGRSSIRHRRAGVPEAPGAMGRPSGAEHRRRAVPQRRRDAGRPVSHRGARAARDVERRLGARHERGRATARTRSSGRPGCGRRSGCAPTDRATT